MFIACNVVNATLKQTGNMAYVIGVGMTKFEKPLTRDWDYPDMGREAGNNSNLV